jgi:hypothetical protein
LIHYKRFALVWCESLYGGLQSFEIFKSYEFCRPSKTVGVESLGYQLNLHRKIQASADGDPAEHNEK